jgi:hypothetical protein
MLFVIQPPHHSLKVSVMVIPIKNLYSKGLQGHGDNGNIKIDYFIHNNLWFFVISDFCI